MWQLELLSWVIPAFGALAKDFIDCENPDAHLCQDASDCYSDIVSIGAALSVSGGEWAAGLREEKVSSLLTALESRLPKRRTLFSFIAPFAGQSEPREQFPKLDNRTISIKSRSLGGYEECGSLPNLPIERREEYLKIMSDVPLFHGKETKSEKGRKKFLERVREATEHLLDVYCKDRSGQDAEEFNLSQYPGHGIKDRANIVYNILEQHWKCNCTQRPTQVREVRLSLIRHRQLAPKRPSQGITVQDDFPTKFEVLLPVCKTSVPWKVANVQVDKKIWPNKIEKTDCFLVQNNTCSLLKDESLRVDFLADRDRLWHRTPRLVDHVNCYASMESLHQLLGDGVAVSDISRYTLRETLTLCYILANSMLFLYPGSWSHTAWSSNEVYFIGRLNRSNMSNLTFPYLAVKLEQAEKASKQPRAPLQYHPHPVILSLGIIFLEIATGERFTRTLHAQEHWEQCNNDGPQALRQLQIWENKGERDRSKRISPALKKAIRSCLMAELPPDIPSNSLFEEGPIRHYILTCIVQPLASELRHGHKISLEELHINLVPEKDKKNTHESNGQRNQNTRRRLSSTAGDFTVGKMKEDASANFTERREVCLLGTKEVLVDNSKRSMMNDWFEWHKDALSRIERELRKSDVSNAQSVKIAILDSGIELSPDQKDMYNTEPKMKYYSWIDNDQEWKDDVGHGTHLAVLIRKIAPHAVVHVARVFKKKPTVDDSAENIVKAIRHAVDDWEVDIIIMSFGFGNRNDMLYDEIKYAASKDVLIFAAASNDGKNRPDGVAWPAKETSVICVHSGDGLGNSSSFTPSPKDNMRIMVLGECVPSAWPPKLKSPGDLKYMSGTSCAAPIAGGIAAVILDYSRGFLTESEWKSLRQTGSVRRMFEGLRDPNKADYWWIQHWALFAPNREESWIQGEIRGFL